MTKSKRYTVTLRRDVQQKVTLEVEASTRQEAIDVAESMASEVPWKIEEHIGTHRPETKQKP